MIFGVLNPEKMKIKNDFFGFPTVKWLQYTGKVGKCISY